MSRNSRYFFFRPLAPRVLLLAGPFAALASISATASSSVTAFGSALFGKRRMGRAVADVGAVAAGHHLDLLARFRDAPRAPRSVRASRRVRPWPRAASASLTTAAFMPVSNTSAVEPSRAYLPSCSEIGAIAPDRCDDRLAGLRDARRSRAAATAISPPSPASARPAARPWAARRERRRAPDRARTARS